MKSIPFATSQHLNSIILADSPIRGDFWILVARRWTRI
jgi:hypothetical protein